MSTPEMSASRASLGAPGLAALAAVALALALAVSQGFYDLGALALVTLAACAALAALFSPSDDRKEPTARIAVGVLALGLGASLAYDALHVPGVLVDPAKLGPFRPVLGVAGLLLLTHAWRDAPRWLARIRFPAIVLLGTAAAAMVILASPRPVIDVWQIQQAGARGLLTGWNPYALGYRNPYGPDTPYLDPSLLSPDGRFITAFPYMPLVLVLDVPGVLLGDVRWSMVAALAASAFLVRALGKGSLASELAAALLLLQPKGWMVLELSWTEPLALAGMLTLALTVTKVPGHAQPDGPGSRRGWLLPGLAAAFAVSTKQYMPLLALPFLALLPSAARVRAILVAAAGALALVLPFLVADPRAFVRGVLEFQLRQPFRPDALSWPAALRAAGGPILPSWPAFLLAGAILVASMRGRMTVGRALLASASAWIVFVAFNKQAFVNYYWMGVGLLCAAVAAIATSPREDEGAPMGSPP
jgi:hypothetical protein